MSSFWTTAERANFAALCVTRFGRNFDQSDVFMVRSDFITPYKQPILQNVSEAHRERGAAARRKRQSFVVSEKAMQRTGDLIQGGR
jgi:hypothetical protein